ncbi:hypothetical protein OG579_16080 [Williamsia herbipolensis]|uniref:Glycosyltransferase involved in cell wall biosynthesis n=1 Tax=Williamsia herbipolensis TaxID=1603258 RepID=A0AAU4JZK7_9NOCA|nr:hypothetical protein [Williamsia herbipolensis]
MIRAGESVTHLLVGPPEHGVVRYGTAVHAALAADDPAGHALVAVPAVDSRTVESVCTPASRGLVHLQFTDRLFGASAPEAAAAATGLVTALHDRGARVTATLHDLPQPSDGTGFTRRVECYRRVAAALDAVVVSSDHESALYTDHLGLQSPPEVIPLMVETLVVPPGAAEPSAGTVSVGVLGFLYPGKGHIETLRAMDDLDADIAFVALGAPSPGHDDLVDELEAHATAVGRPLEVTGFLDDAELYRRMATITVPVAHHRHMSASASVNTWRSLRRAPLVPRTRYTEEMATRSPGTLVVYADADLPATIAAALDDPSRTRIGDDIAVHPTPAEVAAAHSVVFERVCR